MKKRNMKYWGAGLLIVVLLVGVLLSFRPSQLADLIDENHTVCATTLEAGFKNGVTYNDSEVYDAVTKEQTRDIAKLFRKYAYLKKLDEIVSDGSFPDFSAKWIMLYVYEGNTAVHNITIVDQDVIVIDRIHYQMEDSSDLIEELREILMDEE